MPSLLVRARQLRQHQAMDAASFFSKIREHYVEQFLLFVEEQKRNSNRGAAEVKLQLGAESELFRRLYCVDFLKNDERPEVMEFQPGSVLRFNPISFLIGRAAVTIDHLGWDEVLVRHNCQPLPTDGLAVWFDRWFDPGDVRHIPDAKTSNVIHSLVVRRDALCVDFGTAPANAFLDLIGVLEQAGATDVRVSGSRAAQSGQ